MKAKDLLKKVCRNYMDIECSDVIEISEDAPISGYFPIADECDVEDGEYFYTYLEDEQEMKDTEKFLGQPFDYAFPLRDCDEWVGLVRIVETHEEVLTDKDSEFLETFYGSPMTVGQTLWHLVNAKEYELCKVLVILYFVSHYFGDVTPNKDTENVTESKTHENPGQGKRGNGIRFGWASLDGTFSIVTNAGSTM